MKANRPYLTVFALLILALVSLSSHAIIVRHDVLSTDYEISRTDYPAVFFLERQGSRKICVATVIHPQWALTAAHCAEETMLEETVQAGRRFGVMVGGQDREIDAVIKHPLYDQESSSDVDLALLRFRSPSATPRPLPLQQKQNELGAEVTIVGWGYFGLGTLGRQYDDGRMRRATNRITAVQRYLRLVFDDPRDHAAESLPLEGAPSLGDSGGPALIDTELGLHLAGIAVGQIQGADFSEETQGRYGAVAIYERISSHIDWIEEVVGSEVPFDS
ncbi:MAG: trypsin-like serine protease [Pseudomonadales bacterium]|nr:trypsin-like serine protease [Pseudomonadales bacterium]